MNRRSNFILLIRIVSLALVSPAFADANPTDSVGIYYISTNGTGQSVKTSDGSSVRLGARADIRILKAHIYSENNANTTFLVYLDTSGYAFDPKVGMKSTVLRIGDRNYVCSGGGGRMDFYNTMDFVIPDKEEAEVAARSLSADCLLRKPPGYKFLARFVPTKPEFQVGEPVLVNFKIKNLDDRTIVFQKGGSQRGARDNQYGFRAMLYNQPVLDTGNPLNFGGLFTLVKLEPGKELQDQIDLGKWFGFGKPGTYSIHGFYRLGFYPADAADSFANWNLMWSDYASADFEVIVK